MNCHYHPIYRCCQNCGHSMEREQVRDCLSPSAVMVTDRSDQPARTTALCEARALILKHAMSTWRGGLTERSDGITEVLVEFDQAFPEALER